MLQRLFGSLFLRIFAGFWLAMVIITVTAIYLSFQTLQQAGETVTAPRELITGARDALAGGGRQGLVEWLERRRDSRPPLLIVDATGRELLGRPLRPRVQRVLRRRGGIAPGVVPLTDAAGNTYRAVLAPPPFRVGPLRLESPRRGIVVAALIISALVCYWLTRQLVRPIRRIGAAAHALGGGDLRARAALDAGGSELIALGRQFDEMAARVEALLTGQRELLRNVSHELRSPLARLRLALELARSNEARLDSALARIERETIALDGLIAQVLRLARVSDPEAPFPVSALDLAALLQPIIADARFEAGAAGRDLQFRNTANTVQVLAPAELLSAAIENVVRNALRYSDSSVEVTLVADDGRATVTVEDDGPGVPAESLDAIFEPFHRTAVARERDSGGEGIGLAITRAVVGRVGGRVYAENRSGGGLRVVLAVPLAPSESAVAARSGDDG